MRDIISCFSENAVNVRQQASCSSYSSSSNACINPSLTPSTRNSVSSVYRSTLSNKHQILMITVTWCKSFSNQGLTISFGTQDPPSPPFRLNTNSRFFRKKKGSKLMVESSNHESRIEVFWDLSNAKYDTGPEPVDGYYVAVVVGLEIALIIGHIAEESVTKKLKAMAATSSGKFSLLSRREHCSGNTLYTTKAQFCENGTWHDIMIRCSGGNGNEGLLKSSSSSSLSSSPPALMVCIDKKTVIRVKRLQWNFRGNQTIFVDGLLVDLLWDVHNWFFNPSSSSSSSSGYAVFMFRTRSGLDSRLWLQEKPSLKDKDALEFSFLIYACKTA